MGNWLSDKYAEGTIGRRFYAGCRNVDTVEQIAADHATALFGAAHAYVQPHSGIDANLVAFWAVLAQRVEAPALARAQAATSTTCPTATGKTCAATSATSGCSA
ncbi:Serine hydroxymethyltransferase [[Actinomadura] parvosata subsp. kistnae]|nr:Serine hydroxymethyltransferase [Actinomadura parvosata subsp. kistnae]